LKRTKDVQKAGFQEARFAGIWQEAYKDLQGLACPNREDLRSEGN